MGPGFVWFCSLCKISDDLTNRKPYKKNLPLERSSKSHVRFVIGFPLDINNIHFSQ